MYKVSSYLVYFSLQHFPSDIDNRYEHFYECVVKTIMHYSSRSLSLESNAFKSSASVMADIIELQWYDIDIHKQAEII